MSTEKLTSVSYEKRSDYAFNIDSQKRRFALLLLAH